MLVFLLRHPQKLISKEELLNAVWGDAAVTESSLTRTIAQIRRLLGDDAQTDPTPSDFDGLLSTSLFSLVFINHTGHFAVFDPW